MLLAFIISPGRILSLPIAQILRAMERQVPDGATKSMASITSLAEVTPFRQGDGSRGGGKGGPLWPINEKSLAIFGSLPHETT